MEDLVGDLDQGHDNMHILRYNVLSTVQDGGRPSAEENPADLFPHTNRKRARAGMAEGTAARGTAGNR
jgi:hypothetical protein